MLARSQILPEQPRDAAFPAQRIIAAAPLSPQAPLALPTIGPGVPAKVAFISGDEGATDFARWLAEADVLTLRHWANGNVVASCAHALREFCHAARPRPLAKMTLSFTDDDVHLSTWSAAPGAYQRQYELKQPPAKLGCLCLHIDSMSPVHLNIGPALRHLETRREGLGQTVLATLDRGLWQSCRGCGPRAAYQWAQYIYWASEADESMRHQEELDDMLGLWEQRRKENPKDAGPKPTLNDVEGFKKSDFDRAIPGWAGSGRIQSWPVRKLQQCRALKPAEQEIVRATIALKQLLRPRGWFGASDLQLFDHGCSEVVPFILRWNGYNDPIGQIYDDVVNNEMEAGEREMDTNAIFAFHDGPSLRRALKKLRRYLVTTQLCENIIRLIGEKI